MSLEISIDRVEMSWAGESRQNFLAGPAPNPCEERSKWPV